MSNQAYILGYVDEKVTKKSPVDCYTNKIGGKPNWPEGSVTMTPSCKICGSPITLVVQVYCPLDSMEERTLYLCVCLTNSCRNNTEGWSAYRCQGKLQSAPADQLAEQVEQQLNLDDQSAPKKGKNKLRPPFFNSYYIATDEEYLQKILPGEEQQVGRLLKSYGETSTEGTSRGGSDGYEKVVAKHGDLVAQRFVNRVKKNPGHILRYKVGGDPLHISKVEQARYSAPSCQYCGAKRQFEFQIMPPLQRHLYMGPKIKDISVEFETVIVATCTANCWSGGELRGEHAALQLDPETEKLNQLFG